MKTSSAGSGKLVIMLMFCVLCGTVGVPRAKAAENVWPELPPPPGKAELQRVWKEMLGYAAPELVGKIAPDIKPGVVINAANCKDFPGLKELLPPSGYNRLQEGAYNQIPEIKVAETRQYYNSKNYALATMKNSKYCKIGADGYSLEGHISGWAFTHPKEGIELIHNIRLCYFGDQGASDQRYHLYNRTGKKERAVHMTWYVLWYKNRTDFSVDTPSIQPNPNNILNKFGVLATYPRDIQGQCLYRCVYDDQDKPDDFMAYIPGLRRFRRLAGTDTQDSMFGTDIIMDDAGGFYQKVSASVFPNKYKIIGEGEILNPRTLVEAARTAKFEEKEGRIWYDWERRPVWVLEVESLDKNYIYGKRILWIDKETFGVLATELFDRRGNLFRSWYRNYRILEDTGYATNDFITIEDHVNTHKSIIDTPVIECNPRWLGEDYFDLRFLSRQSK